MRYVFYYAADVRLPRGQVPVLMSKPFRSRAMMIAWSLFNRTARAALFAGRWRVLIIQEQ